MIIQVGALNSHLHAYRDHMYKAEALWPRLRVTEIDRDRLDTMSRRNALENLQRVFPYGVRYRSGTFRSWFQVASGTEKPHLMMHWADN
jgi:hypothetical protein